MPTRKEGSEDMRLTFPKMSSALTKGIAAGAVMAVTLPVAETAVAYFTSNASAEGGFVLRLSPKTDMKETYGQRTKHVLITNDAESIPLYVRARAFSSMPVSYAGNEWVEGDDGWLYCKSILEPGKETPILDVSITFPTGGTETVTDPDGTQTSVTIPVPATGDEHDVVVVYETTAVLYDGTGDPLPPDECWNTTEGEGR